MWKSSIFSIDMAMISYFNIALKISSITNPTVSGFLKIFIIFTVITSSFLKFFFIILVQHLLSSIKLIKIFYTLSSSKYDLTLIWVSSLEVPFEVGWGVKVTPPPLFSCPKFDKIMLET